MAYQSKHTGTAIDNGIDINTTQNSRLTTIEGNISSLQTLLNNVQTSLNTTISNIQKQLDDLSEELAEMEIVKLNYSIKGGTSQPSGVQENTIWVNTSTSITSTIFSSATPKNPSQGMLWIITGITSNADFYALNINNNAYADRVYPVGAKQYISGSWVQKVGKIYKNNSWVPFETYLVYGGQYQTNNTMTAYGYGTLKQTNDFIRSYMPENEYATYEFNQQINTRDYTKAIITINGGSINYGIWFGFTRTKGVVPTKVNVNVFEVASVSIPRSGTTVTGGTYTIDLTNINEELWFGFLTSGSDSSNTSTYGYGGIDIISIILQ